MYCHYPSHEKNLELVDSIPVFRKGIILKTYALNGKIP
ncbi:MAG: hypothetical protein OJF50_002350 [Nitrospira sp.]|nr:hypothetical protein [Nitrospira sp.]